MFMMRCDVTRVAYCMFVKHSEMPWCEGGRCVKKNRDTNRTSHIYTTQTHNLQTHRRRQTALHQSQAHKNLQLLSCQCTVLVVRSWGRVLVPWHPLKSRRYDVTRAEGYTVPRREWDKDGVTSSRQGDAGRCKCVAASVKWTRVKKIDASHSQLTTRTCLCSSLCSGALTYGKLYSHILSYMLLILHCSLALSWSNTPLIIMGVSQPLDSF